MSASVGCGEVAMWAAVRIEHLLAAAAEPFMGGLLQRALCYSGGGGSSSSGGGGSSSSGCGCGSSNSADGDDATSQFDTMQLHCNCHAVSATLRDRMVTK